MCKFRSADNTQGVQEFSSGASLRSADVCLSRKCPLSPSISFYLHLPSSHKGRGSEFPSLREGIGVGSYLPLSPFIFFHLPLPSSLFRREVRARPHLPQSPRGSPKYQPGSHNTLLNLILWNCAFHMTNENISSFLAYNPATLLYCSKHRVARYCAVAIGKATY